MMASLKLTNNISVPMLLLVPSEYQPQGDIVVTSKITDEVLKAEQ
jgi:hypothetical protein